METSSPQPAPKNAGGQATPSHHSTDTLCLCLLLSLISFPLSLPLPSHPSLIPSPLCLSFFPLFPRSQLISQLQVDPGLAHGPRLPSMASSVQTTVLGREGEGKGRDGKEMRRERRTEGRLVLQSKLPQTDTIPVPLVPSKPLTPDPAHKKAMPRPRSQD